MPEHDRSDVERLEPAHGALLEEDAEDLYENAPCGYLSTLPGGTIVKVNGTFLAWTGFAREDLVGRRRFQDLLTAGGRIFHETHYAPLLRMQGAVREIAVEIVCADGRRLPVLINSVQRTDAQGSPVLNRTTVFNATDRKEYERELVRARERERQARERTERLQRLTARLAAGLGPQDIAAVGVEELTAELGADAVAFAALDGDSGELEVLCELGDPAALPIAAPTPGVAADAPFEEALGSGRAVFHETRSAHPPSPGPGALAILPLVVDRRPLGVVTLAFSEERRFTEEERAFMIACANQSAQALERARLHAITVDGARRSGFLAEMSRAFDELQTFRQRAQRLLDLVVPDLAEAAWISTAPSVTPVAVTAASARRLDSAATAAPPEGPAREAGEQAIASSELQVVSAADEPRGGRDAGPAWRYFAIPLRARRETLGALVLATGERRRLRQRDLPFLRDLGDRAALALDNARLYEQEHDVARTLQRSLLAADPPSDERFTVAARYLPAVQALAVGGDWYDVFETAEGRIGVVVGDVVGRGLEAATAMGQLRSAIRALAGAGFGPAAVLGHLDAFVERVESARVATVAYAEVTLATGAVRYACAGHPPPVLVEPDGEGRLLWEARSLPLGASLVARDRAEAQLAMVPGARLVLYTDGLVERRNGLLDEQLDFLVEAARKHARDSLPELADAVIEALLPSGDSEDDVCLLCLELAPRPGG